MKFSTFIHNNVRKDGTFKSGGAVFVEGTIQFSDPKGGCSISTCDCSEGHWISISMPRTKSGTVKGVLVNFKDRKEMLKVLKI